MSFRKYAEYKESGVEWLGAVPEHWVITQIKYVAQINPSKSELKTIPLDTPVTFLPMESIGETGRLDIRNNKPLSEVVSAGYTYLAENDVIIAKITPCFENGKGAIATGLLSSMSKTADDSERVRWWPWFIGVIILWAVYLSIIWISNWPLEEKKGEFGDTFGALNALFAGLAFAGVIYAILLQQRELKLQREELELQRKELEDTRAEIKGQKETLQKQNFESSFFQLLGMHSEIVNSIVILTRIKS